MCLSCTGTGERVCLSAEGFGNRQCFLESIADKVNFIIKHLDTGHILISPEKVELFRIFSRKNEGKNTIILHLGKISKITVSIINT